jgi:hypothetical protein
MHIVHICPQLAFKLAAAFVLGGNPVRISAGLLTEDFYLASLRPFSHWGDATAIRSRKKKITLQLATGRTFSSKWRFSPQRDHDAMTTRHE